MIIHIDMDAFYASVEQLDDPGLKGKCVIVGGLSGRGVVSAASYEARKYGVHSAMPMFQARKLCPKGVYLSPRMDRYRQISETIMGLLRSFTPLVEAVSIDEAYMDVTGCRRLFGPPEEIGRQIKQAIRDAVELSCSVGIAPNMFLAKVASDMDKPDGLTVIGESEAREFIETLPILKVPGVGKKTGGRLAAMGIETLGDVESCCSETLQKRLGRFGLRLKDLSRGVDRSRVTPYTPSKSISSERTLSVDTDEMTLLAKHLLDQAETVARNLRSENVRAKTVMLKLKYADFKTLTKSTTLSAATCSSKTLYEHAEKLLLSHRLLGKVRLIGLGASGFVSAQIPVQKGLFEARGLSENSREKVDKTLDLIKEKFGSDAIKRATQKGLQEKPNAAQQSKDH